MKVNIEKWLCEYKTIKKCDGWFINGVNLAAFELPAADIKIKL